MMIDVITQKMDCLILVIVFQDIPGIHFGGGTEGAARKAGSGLEVEREKAREECGVSMKVSDASHVIEDGFDKCTDSNLSIKRYKQVAADKANLRWISPIKMGRRKVQTFDDQHHLSYVFDWYLYNEKIWENPISSASQVFCCSTKKANDMALINCCFFPKTFKNSLVGGFNPFEKY